MHSNKKEEMMMTCFFFFSGVCNYNGKHGCLKCTTIGEYSHKSNTVYFPDSQCIPRTDEEFRSESYGRHHKMNSPLLNLPINMIVQFPVSDSLHLIDLGVMKRLLIGWRDGNFGRYTTKWRAAQIQNVTMFLRSCKMPAELHRAVRGLDCLAYWKASEFRTFLYYLSVVILPDFMCADAYFHFLALFCAVTLCSSNAYDSLLPVARKLFLYFVDNFKDIYGVDYITSNIHNLTHVVDEVEKFGPLHTFNAYPFENHLYVIKNMLRHGSRPLAQVAKRLSERVNVCNVKEENKMKYPFTVKKKVL